MKVALAPAPAIVIRAVVTFSPLALTGNVPAGTLIVSSAPVPLPCAAASAPSSVHVVASHWLVVAVELTLKTAAPAVAGAARPANSARKSAARRLVTFVTTGRNRRAPESFGSSLGSCRVALALAHHDRLLLHEVLDRHGALSHLRRGRSAGVRDEPLGAPDRRRAVL